MRATTIVVCLLSGLAACDQEMGADEDAADASDGETAGGRGSLYGVYGADPESRMFVEGEATYTPSDPAHSGLVVLGREVAGARVIAALSAEEGGAVIASRGRDEEAKAEAVGASEPVVDRHAETGSWLVVAGRPVIVEGPEVDARWAARAPSDERRLPDEGSTFVARMPIAVGRLPEEVRRVIGAEVRVFDAEREVCIARIAGLELEARLVHEALGPWDPRYSEREVLARGLRGVVATLEPLAGGPEACAHGVVAIGVRAASPSLFREVAVPPSVRRKAVGAMCGLGAWQEKALAEVGAPKLWSPECRALSERAEVRLFETRTGERFVLVSDHGLHAGFRDTAGGLDSAWAHASERRAEAIIDVQGDGVPELVLAGTYRSPASIAGVAFAGDLSEPTFTEDWTPVPPRRLGVGGFTVPDYSVFEPR